MIQSDLAAVSYHTVDKLHLLRMQVKARITFVQYFFKTKWQDIIHRRLHALWDNTGFTLVEDPLRAGYYSEIDMLVWAKKFLWG